MITVGLEIEFVSVPRIDMEYQKIPGWTWTTDGSVRNHRNRYLQFPSNISRQRIEYGGEFVSGILKLNDLSPLDRALDRFANYGEVGYGSNSVHIHVGVPRGVSLHKVVKYFTRLQEGGEENLFNISVPPGQKVHRGVLNDYIYCRPMASPQYVSDGGRLYYPAIGKLENVKSLQELKMALGRLDTTDTKWWPPRYQATNPVAYITHGTIEFRTFNFSIDPLILRTWIYYCVGHVMGFFREFRLFDLEESILLGARLAEDSVYPHIFQRIISNLYRENYGKIDLTPVRTHTGRTISWRGAEDFAGESVSSAEVRYVYEPHPHECLENLGGERIFIERGQNV